MKRISVLEHDRLSFGRLSPTLQTQLLSRLERFDTHHHDDPVFAWGNRCVKARQWVGVVQVPGLQVEILPKTDDPGPRTATDRGLSNRWQPSTRWEKRRQRSRANLLYMLQVAGVLKFRDRATADFRDSELPILDAVGRTFAVRLQRELLRGLDSSYIRLEENSPRFRGKLLIPKQVRYNAAHRERFFCRSDEFLPDTRMNRVFKAVCHRLLDVTTRPATQEPLRHCLLLLNDVTNAPIGREVFDTVVFDRQNERFKDLFEFCRWVIEGRSPALQAGRRTSFSLLFNMNAVFETFVAEFLRRRVAPEIGCRMLAQSSGRPVWLMKPRDGGRGGVRLRPDVLIEGSNTSSILDRERNDTALVLDTKWKKLEDRKRPSNADLYQLYAYLQRFGTARSILLYPRVVNSRCRDFDIIDSEGQETGQRIAVRFVNLDRDLGTNAARAELADELKGIVASGLGRCRPSESA